MILLLKIYILAGMILKILKKDKNYEQFNKYILTSTLFVAGYHFGIGELLNVFVYLAIAYIVDKT